MVMVKIDWLANRTLSIFVLFIYSYRLRYQ
jgi:hypothetical protein